MDIALGLLMLLAGLAFLYWAGEAFVKGSVGLAYKLGVPVLVVGVFLVGFGTSTPELITDTLAAARGVGNLAVGDILGSNLANICLVLGLSAALRPILSPRRQVMGATGTMLIALALFVLFSFLWGATPDGRDTLITRWEGAVMLGVFAGLMFWVVRRHRHDADVEEVEGAQGSLPWVVLYTLVGLAGVLLGAWLAVEGAVRTARAMGVSETVIGLTIVAIGTSLPELATSLVAIKNRVSTIVVGNVLGSSMFNPLFVGGWSALVRPLPVEPQVRYLTIPVLAAVSLLLVPIFRTGERVSRAEGLFLLAVYIAFFVLLGRAAGGG